jgi:hypothetical protein
MLTLTADAQSRLAEYLAGRQEHDALLRPGSTRPTRTRRTG